MQVRVAVVLVLLAQILQAHLMVHQVEQEQHLALAVLLLPMQEEVVEVLHQEQAVQVAQAEVVLEEIVILMLYQELLIQVAVVEELQALVALIPQVEQAVAEQLSSHTLAHKYLQAEL
jgi:hypothetical protein